MNVVMFIAGFVAAVTLTAEGSSSLRDKVKKLQKDLGNADGKIASFSKKMKKQMKKELRNNIFPKIRNFVEESMKEVAERTLYRTLNTMEVALETINKKILSMEKRLETVEEENVLLRTSLKSSEDNCVSYILTINGCPMDKSQHRQESSASVTSSASSDMKVTSAVTDMTTQSDAIQGVNMSTPRPGIVDDVTFKVSSYMPQVWTGMSIMVTAGDDLTRILLENPADRGSIKTDKYVESIAYDLVSKKLFWSSSRPKRPKAMYVHSAGLDGSDLTLLLEGKRIFSLAVDGVEQIVFMSDWTTSAINSMSTTGQNFKVVRGKFKTIRNPKTIVLETQGRRLFFSFTSEIFSMKYDGSQLKRLATGSWMKPMALDHVGGVLYFSDKKNLYGLKLATKKKVLVNQMNHDMNTLVFHEDMLYIAYQKHNVSIDNLDLRANTVTPFTFVQGEWFRMCLIPAS